MANPQEGTNLFKVDLDMGDNHKQEFYDQYRNHSSNPKLKELLKEYDDVFKEKLP